VDVQGLFHGLGRGRVLTRQPPHHPDLAEGAGLAGPVAEVAVDVQRPLQGLSRAGVITCHPARIPQVVEGVGLAQSEPWLETVALLADLHEAYRGSGRDGQDPEVGQ